MESARRELALREEQVRYFETTLRLAKDGNWDAVIVHKSRIPALPPRPPTRRTRKLPSAVRTSTAERVSRKRKRSAVVLSTKSDISDYESLPLLLTLLVLLSVVYLEFKVIFIFFSIYFYPFFIQLLLLSKYSCSPFYLHIQVKSLLFLLSVLS